MRQGEKRGDDSFFEARRNAEEVKDTISGGETWWAREVSIKFLNADLTAGHLRRLRLGTSSPTRRMWSRRLTEPFAPIPNASLLRQASYGTARLLVHWFTTVPTRLYIGGAPRRLVTETNRKGGGDSIRVESANLGVARDTTTDAPHVCQANLACR
jgi:hypothetical protein